MCDEKRIQDSCEIRNSAGSRLSEQMETICRGWRSNRVKTSNFLDVENREHHKARFNVQIASVAVLIFELSKVIPRRADKFNISKEKPWETAR